MGVPASLFPELEDVVRYGTAERRAKTLRTITTLFIDSVLSFTDAHVALFDDVISYLIEDIQPDALAELAQRLAPVPNAPGNVISKLGRNDNIKIARPILKHASLASRDLLDIAETKSQAHLLAIASRKNLDEALSEVLIARGNSNVIHFLAINSQAKLSRNAYSCLMKKAEQDSLLAEKLIMRRDVPPDFFRELWMRTHEIAADTQEKNQTTEALASGVTASDLELTEAGIAALAKAGKYEETVAALATVCAVPLDIVHRLMSGNRLDPLLILGRSVGFSWATVGALISARRESKLADQMLEATSDYYHRLTPQAAERVVRFWQTRPETSKQDQRSRRDI
jgi:uncharacterized protein (DUF2336 family)